MSLYDLLGVECVAGCEMLASLMGQDLSAAAHCMDIASSSYEPLSFCWPCKCGEPYCTGRVPTCWEASWSLDPRDFIHPPYGEFDQACADCDAQFTPSWFHTEYCADCESR